MAGLALRFANAFMKLRRLVTARNADGKSVFQSAGLVPRTHDYVHVPGMSNTQVWSTQPLPSLAAEVTDPTLAQRSVVPLPGGTQFLVVEFPPDRVFQSPQFDGRAATEENLQCVPGLAECFEPDNPGMHTTDTIDYAIVLDGEIWLELDDGRAQLLRKHDVVVQNGTRHAWRNRGERVALMAFVLIGADRDGS